MSGKRPTQRRAICVHERHNQPQKPVSPRAPSSSKKKGLNDAARNASFTCYQNVGKVERERENEVIPELNPSRRRLHTSFYVHAVQQKIFRQIWCFRNFIDSIIRRKYSIIYISCWCLLNECQIIQIEDSVIKMSDIT